MSCWNAALTSNFFVCCFAWLMGDFILLMPVDAFYAIRRQHPKLSWQTVFFH